MKFTFGSDPEFMLVDGAGKYRSAIGVIPGSKEKRHRIKNSSFYYDNVLAECNIPPAVNKTQAIKNVGTTISQLAKLIDPFGLRLVAQAAQRYPKSELQCKEALEIGCKAESCAYRLEDLDKDHSVTKKIKTKFQKGTLRTAGGHIHLGTPLGKQHLPCVMLVRMMDLFVGVPSLFMDHDTSSTLRRELYGEAGRYRQPKHGVEYRSLGNFWLNSPEMVGLIYDLCAFTVDFVAKERHSEFWEVDEETLDSDDFWNGPNPDPAKCHTCLGYDPQLLRRCFITGDKRSAKPFLKLAFNYLPDELTAHIESAMTPKARRSLQKLGIGCVNGYIF
jgi:hypothetical protein